MGETDSNLKTIKIRVFNREEHPVSRQEMEICLLHELFHAILAEGQYLSSTEDEPLVEWLANRLYRYGFTPEWKDFHWNN